MASSDAAVSSLPLEARLLRGRDRRLPALAALRDWLEQLETARPVDDELLAMLAYAAGRPSVSLTTEELGGARRRALLVHAAGGDLHRDLSLDAPAGETLAVDIDTGERRAQLGRALAGLRDDAVGLPTVRDALARLLADTSLAWRAFAVALLAEELAGDGSDDEQ
jgi:hypothetical protein